MEFSNVKERDMARCGEGRGNFARNFVGTFGGGDYARVG